VNSVADTNYVDLSVENDTTYTYEIAGVDVTGNEGDVTAAVSETPLASEAPSAPTPLSPLVNALGDVRFTVWVGNATNATSRPTEALVYSFVIAGDSALSNVIVTASGVAEGVDSTGWVVDATLFSENETYYWVTRASDSVTDGPISAATPFGWIPVSIQLQSFTAAAAPGGAAHVTWELAADPSAISQVSLVRGVESSDAELVKSFGSEGVTGDVLDFDVPAGIEVSYWIRVLGASGEERSFGPVVASVALPQQWSLSPAYPNPFNPTTEIVLAVPELDVARVVVYNVLGQPVQTLWSGPITPGLHHLVWNGLDTNGRGVASGVYIIRARTEHGVTMLRRVTMVR